MPASSRLSCLRASALALVCASAAFAQTTSPPALRVIRANPNGDANPLAQVTVTFDRPVAGSLDRVVDPTTVFHIEPSIAGKLEWRDPVTIRFVPTATLWPGRTYAVTISNAFRAMDGGALAQPYRFTFRARGSTLLAGTPIGPQGGRPEQIIPNQKFELIYSAPADLEKLSAAAYLEFSAGCSGARIIRLHATSQHAIAQRLSQDDEDEGPPIDRRLDSLRRAVQLVPESPLPHGCAGDLTAPKEIDEPNAGNARMPFLTYGDFRIGTLVCNGDDRPCPRGPLYLHFSTPVRGADVMRRVRIIPDVKLTIRDTMSESTTWGLGAPFTPRVAYAVVVDTAIRDIFGQRLLGNPAAGYRTTGVPPFVNYAFGHLVVERGGTKMLSVQHVNVDTLVALIAPVPDSLEADVSLDATNASWRFALERAEF